MPLKEKIDQLLQKYPKKYIYLDHAATTYVDPLVKEAMDPYFTQIFANPGGFYEIGQKAKDAVEEARATVAKYLNCPLMILYLQVEEQNRTIWQFLGLHVNML